MPGLWQKTRGGAGQAGGARLQSGMKKPKGATTTGRGGFTGGAAARAPSKRPVGPGGGMQTKVAKPTGKAQGQIGGTMASHTRGGKTGKRFSGGQATRKQTHFGGVKTKRSTEKAVGRGAPSKRAASPRKPKVTAAGRAAGWRKATAGETARNIKYGNKATSKQTHIGGQKVNQGVGRKRGKAEGRVSINKATGKPRSARSVARRARRQASRAGR